MYGLFGEGGQLFLDTVGPHTNGLPMYETSDNIVYLHDLAQELIAEDIGDLQFPCDYCNNVLLAA